MDSGRRNIAPLALLLRGPPGCRRSEDRFQPAPWAGWSGGRLSLPGLPILAERRPGVHDELGRLRLLVTGASRAAPTGQLLSPGQPVKLAWPDADSLLSSSRAANWVPTLCWRPRARYPLGRGPSGSVTGGGRRAVPGGPSVDGQGPPLPPADPGWVPPACRASAVAKARTSPTVPMPAGGRIRAAWHIGVARVWWCLR